MQELEFQYPVFHLLVLKYKFLTNKLFDIPKNKTKILSHQFLVNHDLDKLSFEDLQILKTSKFG